MALFLMDHSVEMIMILGWWLSDSFMVNIWLQVIEWTNIMPKGMAHSGNFRDLGSRSRPQLLQQDSSILGRTRTMPKLYLGC